MIKQILLETSHDYRFDKLPLSQQKQYNKIIANIEAEDSEYVISIVLATPHSMDYSVISKFRYIDGMLKLESIETLGEIPSNFKLGDGVLTGMGYYKSKTKIEFENGSVIESIRTNGDSVRGKRSKIIGIY